MRWSARWQRSTKDDMSTPVDTLDGSVISQFEIESAQATSLGELMAYQSSLLTENVRGTAVYQHRFTTRSTTIVDNLLRTVMSTGSPRMRFRLGAGAPPSTVWLPWQDHAIRFYSGILESSGPTAGHHLELETVDDLYTMSKVNKVTVRRGAISDMVATIAQENKLDAIIEKTQNSFSFVQSFIDDSAMLFERLRGRAVNAKGRGNYVCYIRDGILHFHSPDYQAEVKELAYFKTPHVSLAQADNSQRLWDAGVSGTHLVVYDPYTAEVRTTASDPTKALRLANGIYNLPSVGGAERNIFYHLSMNRPEEALALAQNAYEMARSQTFEIVATFARLTSLRAGDFIHLLITPSDQASSPWSGYYLLAKTVTTIDRGAAHVVCALQRGEIQQMQSSLTVQAPNQQLVPVTEAPGQDLNLRASQDSVLTRASGKKTSSSVFSTVLGADELPTA